MGHPLLILGLGAAAMYFLDPQNGRKRRNDLQNQLESTRRELEHGRDVVVRDATNRAHGLLVETRHALEARRTGEAGDNVPTLAGIACDVVAPWGRTHWSPAQRAIAGGLGAAVSVVGYFRGGLRGMALCALGGSLVARATANEDMATLVKRGTEAAAHAKEEIRAHLPHEATPRALGGNGADTSASPGM
jgi:hypothetical protein